MDKRQKILIVDDSKLNRDILKEILGDAYNYLEAENGNQAIQRIGENIGIDLMLLDINMPQMNGFEVLKIMKRSQCIAETPVIMISSEDAVDTYKDIRFTSDHMAVLGSVGILPMNKLIRDDYMKNTLHLSLIHISEPTRH